MEALAMPEERFNSREKEYRDALVVLHATCDGEALDLADLQILEDVVAFGTSGLSRPRQSRWERVVSLCERNEYVSDFQPLVSRTARA